MNSILKEISSGDKTASYINDLKTNTSPITLSGLSSMSKINFIALSKELLKKTVYIITSNELQAKNIQKNLKYFSENVLVFPKREIVTYDYVAESKDLPFERIEILNKLYQKKADFVIVTVEALMQNMIPKELLYKNIIELKVGKSYDIENLKNTIKDLGYVRTDLIEGKGQFSVRGGIIDISINTNTGIRIEFWGDEIDSIRTFDIITQRSKEMQDEVKIYPAHEFLLEKEVADVAKSIRQKIFTEEIEQKVEEDIEQITNGNYLSKIDRYFRSFYTKISSFIDYIPDDALIFIDEQNKIEARCNNILEDNNLVITTLKEKEKIIPDTLEDLAEFDEIYAKISKKRVVKLEEQDVMNNSSRNLYRFNMRDVFYYKSEMNKLFTDLKEAISNNKKILILGGEEESARKMSMILLENDIKHKYVEKLDKNLENGIVTVSRGIFSSGFEDFDLKLLVISGNELFEENHKRKSNMSKAFKQGEKIVFADLKPGDIVVHQTNGIGEFIGINTITADKKTKDYIRIKYQDDDILYVPVNQLDNVRKYVGGEENSLKLSKLGSKDWTKTKAKVKSSLKEVARNLIELYARREKSNGYAYSKDTPWQKQFEDTFPYQETEDQLRSIEEMKKDMENNKPMDRLLCGDVGYGKTEVAIRGAFKACMDGKQVAYLVPTTILAQQQYEGFKERMKDFPVRIELLNRFKTTKQQNDIIRRLKLGEVDIVIGTHRLISKDVNFKDLGLLIIDEEHRFGVKAKEKIKELKSNIDVLSMSATPIPRTLHMSIVGVRDMSCLYTPPQNRKSVQTYVLEYDDEVIKEAITKELERGGQVFYLYNVVENIQDKARYIQNLVPQANVSFAHGRMTGTEIENIMKDFILNKSNVIVCTTILESGIDIPNANTIIVENADRLGLAQLYQIRGRVGRSDRQAYAYITYKRDKLLSEVADKRLKAIKEFTEFGSGFKIAMRDLEIRGAGSMLGEIQHGHMEQVGYDTYCKLLDEVIKEEQGIEIRPELDLQIDLNVSSFLPDSYIQNSSQKIEIYQDIALCRSEEDIQNVIDEMIDRYGRMPSEAENLIQIARIKNIAKRLYVTKISQKRECVLIYFEKNKMNINLSYEILEKYKNKIKISQEMLPFITLKVDNLSDIKLLLEIKEFLAELLCD